MDIVRGIRPVHRDSVLVKSQAKDYINWSQKWYKMDKWDHLLGDGLTVAVIDSGVPRHKDIGEVIGEDHRTHPQIYKPNNPMMYDLDGHASHVGGILFAKHNGYGVKGLIPNAKKVFLKGLGDDGSGTASDIARCILRAGKLGAKYIVMSLGSNAKMKVVDDAIEFVWKTHGAICFCAGGNDGKSNHVDNPAKHSLTIAVGAHDEKGNRSFYSDKGPELDVYGPGDNILSCHGINEYQKASGSSQANPFVCGVVGKFDAILTNKYGKVTPEIIRDLFDEKIRLAA